MKNNSHFSFCHVLLTWKNVKKFWWNSTGPVPFSIMIFRYCLFYQTKFNFININDQIQYSVILLFVRSYKNLMTCQQNVYKMVFFPINYRAVCEFDRWCTKDKLITSLQIKSCWMCMFVLVLSNMPISTYVFVLPLYFAPLHVL